MDPARLNYLQQIQQQQLQQQQQAAYEQEMQQQAAYGQEMQPEPMQEQQPMQEPQMQQEAPYNPFDTGIRKAIESARESLGMTQKQKDKALNHSMLTFVNNMSQQPRERGFLNNLASVGRAMSPAIMDYNQQEDAASSANYEMGNKILGYQKAKQEAEALEQERAFRRQLAEKQLAEQTRYHDMTFGAARDKADLGQGVDGFSRLSIPELRKARTQKQASAKALVSMKEINKSLDELDKITANNVLPAFGGWSPLTNPIKDFSGQFLGGDNKKADSLKQETAAREDLEAKLGRLIQTLEGKVGKSMYDRLRPNFPNIKKDNNISFRQKIDSLNRELALLYKTDQMRADLGIDVTTNDVYELENQNSQQAELPAEQEAAVPQTDPNQVSTDPFAAWGGRPQ